MRLRVHGRRGELDRLPLQSRLPFLVPPVGRPHERRRPQVDHVHTGPIEGPTLQTVYKVAKGNLL